MAFVRLAVFVVALIAACFAHPDGAPESACETMIPKHNDSVAGSAAPFRLVQDKRDFKGGDHVAVTLSSSGTPFKGFFVKAFDEHNKEIGEFEGSSDTKPVTKCSGVTHTNSLEKIAVKLIWKAPAGASGKVHFRQVQRAACFPVS
ncbi:hypothetical protein HPB50_012448 [Hyalomma asiaticum]|uniref:Uncharacterized protein n=1 Tax=Hyalomma asiaticum TaxID=266040 RepID=A0ACB7S9E6_HYAAI|nr:hypothetical protein HPB50_012448 [Hyalomma asiaticum]